VFTIIIGELDRALYVLYHVAIAILLACGLMVAWRGRSVKLVETSSRQGKSEHNNAKKGA
jgi:hypothetical protein